ncbi:hypothetical protein Peur_025298 [Populus x canadensis]
MMALDTLFSSNSWTIVSVKAAKSHFMSSKIGALIGGANEKKQCLGQRYCGKAIHKYSKKRRSGIFKLSLPWPRGLDIPSLDKKQDCEGPHALLLEDKKNLKADSTSRVGTAHWFLCSAHGCPNLYEKRLFFPEGERWVCFPVPLPVIQLSTKITCFKVGAKNLFESLGTVTALSAPTGVPYICKGSAFCYLYLLKMLPTTVLGPMLELEEQLFCPLLLLMWHFFFREMIQ